MRQLIAITYDNILGIKIPKYVTSWVAQRQLPDFIDKLYHATLRHAEKKKIMKWGKNRDPGYEYPSDIRLDEFEDEKMEDNVNRMKRHEPETAAKSITESTDDSEEAEPAPKAKSWWSYLLIYNYLH